MFLLSSLLLFSSTLFFSWCLFSFFREPCVLVEFFLLCFYCFSFTRALPLNVFVSFGALSLLCWNKTSYKATSFRPQALCSTFRSWSVSSTWGILWDSHENLVRLSWESREDLMRISWESRQTTAVELSWESREKIWASWESHENLMRIQCKHQSQYSEFTWEKPKNTYENLVTFSWESVPIFTWKNLTRISWETHEKSHEKLMKARKSHEKTFQFSRENENLMRFSWDLVKSSWDSREIW